MKPSHLLCAVLAAIAPTAYAYDIQDVCAALDSASPYHASAVYEVLLPQYEDPVRYNVELNAVVTPDDTLSRCDYLIDWSMRAPGGESRGFNAYTGGHHYRFRDKRMQEYHADADPTPFAPQGRLEAGVQRQAQFVQLLPQYVAARLREIAADSCSSYTVRQGRDGRTVVVEGSQSYQGIEALGFRYEFSREDGLPAGAEFCYNPSQVSEQTVSVKYGAPAAPGVEAFGETQLMELYPDAFGRYRENTYTFDNLPGRPLPAFSALRASGERYTHGHGEGFGAPAVIAVLDPQVDGSAALLGALRDAVDASPVAAVLVVAIAGSHADDAETLAGTKRADEIVLVGARGLARSCGVTATPAVMVVSADGTVRNVHKGFGDRLAEDVLQEVALAR